MENPLDYLGHPNCAILLPNTTEVKSSHFMYRIYLMYGALDNPDYIPLHCIFIIEISKFDQINYKSIKYHIDVMLFHH